MANHEEIIADLDAEAHCFVKPVVVQNCAHVEVVRHDESIEAHVFAKEVADDDRGERRWAIYGIQARDGNMADHHAIDGVGEMAEDGEFVGFHEVARSLNTREFVVGIEAR